MRSYVDARTGGALGGKMKKKIFFSFISMFLPIFLFAKDESTMYWEKEIDVDGQLMTYYFMKTDEQLSNNLENFIEILTGINNSYLKPNFNTIKKQMFSVELLEKKYPNIYRLWIEPNISNDSSENAIDWENFKYCFSGQPLNNNSGAFFLFKKIEEKVYFSLTVYMYGGLEWYCTNQTLDLLETVAESNS